MHAKTTERAERKNLDAGQFQGLIDSFELFLLAERKSNKTIKIYTEAARWLAGAHLKPAGLAGWDDVTTKDVQRWIVALIAKYSDSYANNQFRALQQFFKWLATEDLDTPRRNPMAGLKPPKIDEKLVPVFTDDELPRLLATCKGKGFQNRRDAAILALFRDTGIRLAELAGLTVNDVNLKAREATVTGKGGKQRTVRFTFESAMALDRYLRQERATHRLATSPMLWLGIRGPMTDSGIYQMVERRSLQAGVPAFPHKFRHNFSNQWLLRGGAEGDLQELNGWTSPQMLQRYGKSAAGFRARTHYDQVMDGA